jgi:hypothetical protein
MISDKYKALKIVLIDSLKDNKEPENYREAIEYLRGLGYPIDEEISRNKEHDQEFKEALNAADDLFNILKDFTIFKIGKFDEELVKIKEVLKKQDEYYNARISLYKRLLELPKYAKLDEEEKIKLAMKIGALDTRDLSHNKEV